MIGQSESAVGLELPEGGEDPLVGEVTRRAEQDDRVGREGVTSGDHVRSLLAHAATGSASSWGRRTGRSDDLVDDLVGVGESGEAHLIGPGS